MDENNKEQFVDTINCKYPHNNIMEIYYDCGRALPFTVQRFPDGRVSDWYRNQYVEVVRVEPHGKFGKYGKAFGFYFRNGQREDAWENDPEHSWCKKADTEPQEIPNSGCGGWVLLEIKGDPTVNEIKLLGLDDQISFGKYKGKTIREVIDSDWQYIKWAVFDSQRLLADVNKIIEYHESIVKPLGPYDVMTFGKYKGQTLLHVFNKDKQYLLWLMSENQDFRLDWEKLNSIEQQMQ